MSPEPPFLGVKAGLPARRVRWLRGQEYGNLSKDVLTRERTENDRRKALERGSPVRLAYAASCVRLLAP